MESERENEESGGAGSSRNGVREIKAGRKIGRHYPLRVINFFHVERNIRLGQRNISFG